MHPVRFGKWFTFNEGSCFNYFDKSKNSMSVFQLKFVAAKSHILYLKEPIKPFDK